MRTLFVILIVFMLVIGGAFGLMRIIQESKISSTPATITKTGTLENKIYVVEIKNYSNGNRDTMVVVMKDELLTKISEYESRIEFIVKDSNKVCTIVTDKMATRIHIIEKNEECEQYNNFSSIFEMIALRNTVLQKAMP